MRRTATAIRALVLISMTVLSAGCCDEKALPAAFRALNSEKASERNQALLLIAKCGERAEGAVPRIIQLMYDENVGVASSAAYALRCIDSKRARQALKAAEDARAARRAKR
jgi:HEAT repeat protein